MQDLVTRGYKGRNSEGLMILLPTVNYIVNIEMKMVGAVNPLPTHLDPLVAAYAGPSDKTANAQHEAKGNGD